MGKQGGMLAGGIVGAGGYRYPLACCPVCGQFPSGFMDTQECWLCGAELAPDDMDDVSSRGYLVGGATAITADLPEYRRLWDDSNPSPYRLLERYRPPSGHRGPVRGEAMRKAKREARQASPPQPPPPQPVDDALLTLGRHIRMWTYLRPPMAGWLGKADDGFRGKPY